MTKNKFNAGDKVIRRTEGGFSFGARGTLATVVDCRPSGMDVKTGDGKVIRGTDPFAWDIVVPAVPAFKVGDKVRFTNKVQPYWWFKAGETGTIDEVNPRSGYAFGVRVGLRNGMLAFVNAEHIELVKDEPAPAPVAPAAPPSPGKSWIIVLQHADGVLAPALAPKKMTSRSQADAVAKSMAEKHAGQTFVVFEAVASAATVPVPSAQLQTL